jgi:hypothetical protein
MLTKLIFAVKSGLPEGTRGHSEAKGRGEA